MFTPLFHVQLKKKRLKAGLSQKDAARICGISAGRWSHLEQGLRDPRGYELSAINSKLRLGPVFVSPRRANQRLSSDGAKLLAKVPRFQRKERTSFIRFRSASKTYRSIVDGLEWIIRKREDFKLVEYFCHHVPFESGLEVLHVLCLLARGARPVWIVPLSLGHLPHPVVEAETFEEVGHRPHLALSLEGKVYFLQIQFQIPGAPRVDLLVREGSGWTVLEINGPGHDSKGGSGRAGQIGLPTVFLEESQIIRLSTQELRREHTILGFVS